MKRLKITLLTSLAGAWMTTAEAAPSADLLVVVGAPGTEEFGKAFATAATAWKEAGQAGEASVLVIGQEDTGTLDLKAFETAIAESGPNSPLPLWIVLIGHGTFDGREAKFNLRGQDLTASNLASWLEGFQRPIAIVNCSASSAPFIKLLTAPDRVVITATKAGSEDSYARFGEYLATSINNPDADLDRDGGTSLLEAFLAASKGVEEFYEKEGRIKTEQALLDDNGDGFGTPADWFRGVRAVKKPKDDSKPDGQRAHQFHLVPSPADRQLTPEMRQRRDALEADLFALREKKDTMDEEVYFRALERIARELAKIYHPVPEDSESPPPPSEEPEP